MFGFFGMTAGTSEEIVQMIRRQANTVTGVPIFPVKEKITFSRWTRKEMAARFNHIITISRRLPFSADRQGRR